MQVLDEVFPSTTMEFTWAMGSTTEKAGVGEDMRLGAVGSVAKEACLFMHGGDGAVPQLVVVVAGVHGHEAVLRGNVSVGKDIRDEELLGEFGGADDAIPSDLDACELFDPFLDGDSLEVGTEGGNESVESCTGGAHENYVINVDDDPGRGPCAGVDMLEDALVVSQLCAPDAKKALC